MRSRWMVNLLLLIVVALLSIAARRELEQDRRVPTLTELTPETISEIRLERPGAPPVELLRNAGGWRMESPYRVSANETRISQLLGIAETPVFRSVPEGDAAPRLGLEPPNALLSMDGLTLRFGNTDPIDHHRYVAVSGQVHLIGDGFRHHLTAPAEDYVSPRLLPDGLAPAGGNLDGTALDDVALKELGELSGERVVALGEAELTGRLLQLGGTEQAGSLRLLVSADGRRWTRLDQRLVYLLADPPMWALKEDETWPAAAGNETAEGEGIATQ